MKDRKFLITSRPFFPFVDYKPITDEPETIVTLRDSIDLRILNTLAVKLNFSYEIRESPGRAFGEPRDGQYDGSIGKLQREEADFCTMVAPTSGRLRVTLFTRLYPADPTIIASLKPTLLPAHLSLVRPFEGELWFALLASVVAWGVLMWVLQRAWKWAVGGDCVKLSTALLYGWGALMEKPPPVPSSSDSER
ncbi:Ionotropic receptor 40a-like 2, partial [Homarus americanus]